MQNKSLELNKIVGLKIENLRRERGLHHSDVAFAIGCSRVLMINVEAGKHGTSLDNMILLAKLFKVPFKDLLPDTKEYDPELKDPNESKAERLLKKIAAINVELDEILKDKK